MTDVAHRGDAFSQQDCRVRFFINVGPIGDCVRLGVSLWEDSILNSTWDATLNGKIQFSSLLQNAMDIPALQICRVTVDLCSSGAAAPIDASHLNPYEGDADGITTGNRSKNLRIPLFAK